MGGASPTLAMETDLLLPGALNHLRSRLNLSLSPDDGMYGQNDAHYLSCGASALNVLLSVLCLADAPIPRTILDFGAGAGRVTRWLRAQFPAASIHTCDLRADDMKFCEQEFGAETWLSSTDISALQPLGEYDLIWVGSVITHLSAENTAHIISKFVSWLRPGGVVALSFHGRNAFRRQNTGEFLYIHDSGWQTITMGYHEIGYGYADYEAQSGYGVSLTKPAWFSSLVETMHGTRLITIAEAVWDGHHDVVALQLDAKFAGE